MIIDFQCVLEKEYNKHGNIYVFKFFPHIIQVIRFNRDRTIDFYRSIHFSDLESVVVNNLDGLKKETLSFYSEIIGLNNLDKDYKIELEMVLLGSL